MIILHNYNDLVEKRRLFLVEKEKFYKKYFTREDHELEEMLTKEDEPIWENIGKEIFYLSEFIERWERGYKKNRPP